MNIGQPEIAPLVAVREARVVDAEQVQDRPSFHKTYREGPSYCARRL